MGWNAQLAVSHKFSSGSEYLDNWRVVRRVHLNSSCKTQGLEDQSRCCVLPSVVATVVMQGCSKILQAEL